MTPSFLVDGVEQWNKQSAKKIYDKIDEKITFTKAYKGQKTGVELKTLIKPYAKKGTLIVHACKQNKTISYNIKDLFSNDPTISKYALILSRNNFFKIISINDSQPVLKKINQFKLITK